jgi:hypothetical protein
MRPEAPPARDLGPRLLAELGPGNVVLSPLGLQLALATLRAGASGAAREALDEVVGEPPPVHLGDRRCERHTVVPGRRRRPD